MAADLQASKGTGEVLAGARNLGTISLFQHVFQAASKSKRGRGKAKGGGAPAAEVFLAAVGDGHVVLGGPADGTKHPTALLIDTTYGALKGRINLYTAQGEDAGEVVEAITGLACVNESCVAVGTGHSVATLAVDRKAAQGTPATLASVLGSLAVTKSVLTPECAAQIADPVMAHTVAFPRIHGAGWEVDAQQQDVDLNAIAADLLDTTKQTTAAKFDAALGVYIRACKPRRKDRDCDPPGTLYRVDISQHVATQVVEQCLRAEEKEGAGPRYAFFPLVGLTKLVKTKCLSYRDCSGLLEAALEPGRFGLLLACVTHMSAIDEPAIVHSLAVVHERGREDETAMKDVEAEAGAESEFQSFFRHVMWQAWDGQRLIQALKSVAIDVVQAAIEVIAFWLQYYADHEQANQAQLKCSGPIPVFSQVVLWLGHIIDSHFLALVLSDESHGTLTRLNDILLLHTDLCKQLRDHVGLLSHFLSKKPLPGSHAEVGPYTIEYIPF